jgi:hypothetical protein
MSALVPANDDSARVWAREYFAVLRTTRDPWIGIFWFDSKDNRRATIDLIKAVARQDVHRMLITIDEAEAGWDIAHEALRELIIENDECGGQLPVSLAAYRQKILRGFDPKIRSTQKAAQAFRNIAIAYCVETLISRFGLHPTGVHTSACAVTALAMKGKGGQILTHRAVEKLWRDYAPWAIGMPKLTAHLEEFTAKKPAA